MSKYIKKVNWPWVEIEDSFVPDGETVTINMDDVAAVWPRRTNVYKHGIRFKDGSWFEFISSDALKELQELIMNNHYEKDNY